MTRKLFYGFQNEINLSESDLSVTAEKLSVVKSVVFTLMCCCLSTEELTLPSLCGLVIRKPRI